MLDPEEQQEIIEGLTNRIAKILIEYNRLREQLASTEKELELVDADRVTATKDRDFYKKACVEQNYNIEQTLGPVLYGPSEEGYESWGEHIAETLAEEAAKKSQEQQRVILIAANGIGEMAADCIPDDVVGSKYWAILKEVNVAADKSVYP